MTIAESGPRSVEGDATEVIAQAQHDVSPDERPKTGMNKKQYRPVANIGDDETGFTSGDSSRVLTVTGTYTYHCDIHDGMDGVIVVK